MMSVTIYYCPDLSWVGGKCQYMHVIMVYFLYYNINNYNNLQSLIISRFVQELAACLE